MGRKPKVMRYRQYRVGDVSGGILPAIETLTPSRQPSFEADVWVPATQALLTGVIGGTTAIVVAWAVWDVALWPTWGVSVALLVGIAWLWRLRASDDTLWVIERFLGTDIDGDGDVGEPDVGSHIVTIKSPGGEQAAEQRKRQGDKYDAELSRFVRGCADDTSLRRWQGVIGRERYIEFRDALLRSGLAEWNVEDEPRQGWKLSYGVDDVVECIDFGLIQEST